MMEDHLKNSTPLSNGILNSDKSIFDLIDNDDIGEIINLININGIIIVEDEKYGLLIEQNPFLYSIQNNKYELVELLLDFETNINVVNKNEENGLIISALNENYEITKLLLQKGINTKHKDKKNNTALIYTLIHKNSLKFVELFIEFGIDTNEFENKFDNMIYQSIFYNKFDVAKLLFENKSDFSIIYLIENMSLYFQNKFDVYDLIINGIGKIDFELLFYSIKNFKEKLFFYILEKHDFNLNSFYNYKGDITTLLLYLIRISSIYSVEKHIQNRIGEYLISKSNIDLKDDLNLNALCNAILGENHELCSILIKYGGKLNNFIKYLIKNEYGCYIDEKFHECSYVIIKNKLIFDLILNRHNVDIINLKFNTPLIFLFDINIFYSRLIKL
jgi:ankyrin repeat protein